MLAARAEWPVMSNADQWGTPPPLERPVDVGLTGSPFSTRNATKSRAQVVRRGRLIWNLHHLKLQLPALRNRVTRIRELYGITFKAFLSRRPAFSGLVDDRNGQSVYDCSRRAAKKLGIATQPIKRVQWSSVPNNKLNGAR